VDKSQRAVKYPTNTDIMPKPRWGSVMQSDVSHDNQQYPSSQHEDFQSVVRNSEFSERLKRIQLRRVFNTKDRSHLSLKLAF
jgi:hypothetical protein